MGIHSCPTAYLVIITQYLGCSKFLDGWCNNLWSGKLLPKFSKIISEIWRFCCLWAANSDFSFGSLHFWHLLKKWCVWVGQICRIPVVRLGEANMPRRTAPAWKVVVCAPKSNFKRVNLLSLQSIFTAAIHYW